MKENVHSYTSNNNNITISFNETVYVDREKAMSIYVVDNTTNAKRLIDMKTSRQKRVQEQFWRKYLKMCKYAHTIERVRVDI